MRVIFRVDSSLEIGSGHVMRCLTLAHSLHMSGAEIKFISREHDGNLIEKIQLSGFYVYVLQKKSFSIQENSLPHSKWLGASQKEDLKDCAHFLENNKPDWLIVDHYGIDQLWHKNIRNYCKKIMVLDDLADRNHDCDILLDQTIGRKKDDYRGLVPESCKLLLGEKYILLRSEFFSWQKYSLKRRKNPKLNQLLISMGGTDPTNFTAKILNSLKDCKLDNKMNLVVILGEKSRYIENIQSLIPTLNCNVELKINVNNIAEIMANSDYAIGAAGSSNWERCYLGLPSIIFTLAKNQEKISKISNQYEIAITSSVDNLDELCNLINKLEEKSKNIINNSINLIDGKGSLRILRYLK